jgi:hypothetical protein
VPDGSLMVDIISRLGQAFFFEDLRFEEKLYTGTESASEA